MSSETERTLRGFRSEKGATRALSTEDRDLIVEALNQFHSHLNETAITVRPMSRQIASAIEEKVARVTLLAKVIDISKSVTLGNMGEV